MARPNAESIPDQLRRAIEDSGLSMTALSARSGVNHGQVVRFMQGTDIRLETAGRICAALGLTLSASARPRGRPKGEPAPPDANLSPPGNPRKPRKNGPYAGYTG